MLAHKKKKKNEANFHPSGPHSSTKTVNFSLLSMSLVSRGVSGAPRLILNYMGRVSVTPHVCLHSKQSPCESKPIRCRGNLPGSLRLCAWNPISGSVTEGLGSFCGSHMQLRHAREGFPLRTDAPSPSIPPLLLLLYKWLILFPTSPLYMCFWRLGVRSVWPWWCVGSDSVGMISICTSEPFLALGGCFRCVRNESSKLL